MPHVVSPAVSPAVLVVLDGFGLRIDHDHNAIACARTPTLDAWMGNTSWIALSASGEDVGLPPHQMGNSEVGHLTLGAGRIVRQGLTRIDHALSTGTFAENPTLHTFIHTLKENAHNTPPTCHVMGLFSKGGVHSHEEHILAMINLLLAQNIRVYLHVFLDGRDTAPKAALESLHRLPTHPHLIPATLMGRFFAMDRDQRMERTDQAFSAIMHGTAPHHAQSFEDAVKHAYDAGLTDEFIPPYSITHHGQPYLGLQEGEGLIHMNFRADRVRQLLTQFVTAKHERPSHLGPFLGMSDYSAQLSRDVPALFPSECITDGFAQTLSQHHLSLLKVAETEKYAHVTFFFNGGVEEPVAGEDRVLVPSPKVTTYDQAPFMSADAITHAVCDGMRQGYDAIIVNYANPDMVGHTGLLNPTIQAIEHLDACLAQLALCAKESGHTLFITADHGNAECMEDNHIPHTAHTCAPVPFLKVDPMGQIDAPGTPFVLAEKHTQVQGTLSDVAPTLLEFMGVPIPHSMTGQSKLALL